MWGDIAILMSKDNHNFFILNIEYLLKYYSEYHLQQVCMCPLLCASLMCFTCTRALTLPSHLPINQKWSSLFTVSYFNSSQIICRMAAIMGYKGLEYIASWVTYYVHDHRDRTCNSILLLAAPEGKGRKILCHSWLRLAWSVKKVKFQSLFSL